jgi:phosphorylase/glycogen(starch) synthase
LKEHEVKKHEAPAYTLFEISWEVCNKVGGIHTVLSSKARTQVERLGDDYVAIGPWLLSDTEHDVPFDEEPAFGAFAESCRQMGIPVKVGRWRIPAAPRTILVEFSSLYEEKDDVLAELWEDHGVDSISGEWDYVEPVLFGHAVAKVIERWWEEYLDPHHRRAVAHAHEWMTGSALLYLSKHVPAIGTVFTTHATMLGRALSSTGFSPDDGLSDQTPLDLAEEHGVKAKHSLEGTCARSADTFTTVSEITAKEAELLHERAPQPVTPNGIDLELIDALTAGVTRDEVRTKLQQLASRFLGEDVSDAAFVATSGRYEFHNKGFDVLLDALARLEEREGRRIVLFVLAPAGNTGIRSEYLERIDSNPEELDGPIGLSTHNLFDQEHDPVHEQCARLGFDNAPDGRVKVVQIPIYLSEEDGILGFSYEAVLRSMDLTCFPSYYEPWGYTPQESLALGIPTITTDYAGFGRWATNQDLATADGITVLSRVHRSHDEICDMLADEVEAFLAGSPGAQEMLATCRKTAARTSWSGFIEHYDAAYAAALEAVQGRLVSGVQKTRRPRKVLQVQPAPEGRVPRLFNFDVASTLPEELRGLERLARNYWWCWDPEGASLFEELSPLSWRSSAHDPVQFLRRVFPEDVERCASDSAYVARVARVLDRFDAYMSESPSEGRWLERVGAGEPGPTTENPVAYFCAEFGIHESLRIYSGGLGVLAGDHVKSASDLNLPFVAIGLFYRMGYMGQQLGPHAEQVEVDVVNDPRSLPMEPVPGPDGQPLEITLALPGRELALIAWKVMVGRVPLYLLDTNTPSNRPEDRDITRNLYGGEAETRLQQEIVLGRGGVRLLRALGILPSVYHMNEGHAAFLTLERVRHLTHETGLTFEEASELVRSSSLFTTHTPVPAGHDRFGEDVMRRYFSDFPEWTGVPWERFWSLGQAEETDDSFNMSYLAMNFSSFRNGVSRLHGIASRKLFRQRWPGLLESEIPIDTVTNGIHLATWTHPELGRALGAKDRPVTPADFDTPLKPARLRKLWATKKELKHRLVEEIRTRMKRAFLARGDSPLLMSRMLDGLDPDALFIGFARRFAPYKRAELLFQDVDRLAALLDDEERPLRILIAGKAHPRDQHGKDILRRIAERTRDDSFVGRILFLEDYDIELARFLMHGVDVWLNNPTRMLEASGTSGMKAAANGGLNLSIGDGWWPEAFDGKNGWQIGEARAYDDQSLQDELDASVLYRLLEEEILPLYFDRDADGHPAGWLERVGRCLATVPAIFNTDRMVGDYVESAYDPLAREFRELALDRKWKLKARVQESQRIRRDFEGIEIVTASVGDLSRVHVGESVEVHVEVDLGALSPDDVIVELVLGHARGGEDVGLPQSVALPYVQTTESGHVFEGVHELQRSGAFSRA